MEVMDLVYLKLKKAFKEVKGVIVDYIYSRKTWDVASGDLVLLYEVDEAIQMQELGGGKKVRRETFSIDVRTMHKERYEFLKEKIFDVLDAKTQVIDLSNYDRFVNDCKVQQLGANIFSYDGATEDDEGKVLSLRKWNEDLGQYEEVVRIYVIYVKDEIGYGIAKDGTYVLVYPRSVRELSDRLKGIYRFVINVEGQRWQS